MLLIRNVEKKDEKQLLALAWEFHRETLLNRKMVPAKLFQLIKSKHPTRETQRTVAQMITTKVEKSVFVAEINGKLVGYIYGKVNKYPEISRGKVGKVEYWFVSRKWQGKGVGKTLWKHLVAWFKKKKCNKLSLNTFACNVKAIKIYHKMGLIDRKLTLEKKL